MTEVRDWVNSLFINEDDTIIIAVLQCHTYVRAVYSMGIMDMISLVKDTDAFKEECKQYAWSFQQKIHIVRIKEK